MDIEIIVSDEYRKSRLVADGVVIDGKVIAAAPLTDLSRESREVLADLPAVGGVMARRLPRLGSDYYAGWKAPYVPGPPAEWDTVLMLYKQHEAEARARAEAEKRSEVRRSFQVFIGEVEEVEAFLAGVRSYEDVLSAQADCMPANVEAYPHQISLTPPYRAKEIQAWHGAKLEDVEDLLVRAKAANEELALYRDAAIRAQAEADAKAEAKAQRHAAERAAEKVAWVAEHGSDHLKKACEAGYNCQRLYVTERAALEYPKYDLDFDDAAAWRDRACPSQAALAEAQRVRGTVVWLTSPPLNTASREEEALYGGEEPYADCEAVVLRGYLGKYDLVRVFPG